MIEALLVFGSMVLFLWVLRALDKSFWSGKPPELGLFQLQDGSEIKDLKPKKKPRVGGWHA